MKSPTERQSGFFSVAVLIAAIALAAAGGLMYVHYKNRQYLVDRRIERVGNLIQKHRDDIRTMRMDIARMLNCFVISEELDRRGSELQPIAPEVVEVIPSSAGPDKSVAQAQP
jgi:hypothetical protein